MHDFGAESRVALRSPDIVFHSDVGLGPRWRQSPRFSSRGRARLGERLGCSARYMRSAGMTTMTFDQDLIFPIHDFASADLMTLKAACLWNAETINDRQRQPVEQRAQRFLQEDAALMNKRSPEALAVGSDQGSDLTSALVQTKWGVRRLAPVLIHRADTCRSSHPTEPRFLLQTTGQAGGVPVRQVVP
jgi:hypothetical protein